MAEGTLEKVGTAESFKAANRTGVSPNSLLLLNRQPLSEYFGPRNIRCFEFWADYGQTAPYCLLLRPE
jgi:hypothetical protein